MTVFKTYLKVLNRYKMTVILYTVLLVAFAAINNQARTDQQSFEAKEPKVYIEDLDQSTLSKAFVAYMDSKCILSDLPKDQIKDALFYRELDYILTIPEHYEQDILDQKQPEIRYEKSGDFSSYYANMIMERYVEVVQGWAKIDTKVDELLEDVKISLDTEPKVHMESTLDHSSLSALTNYYNFAAYSLLAGVLYIIGLIMQSFKKEEVKKRMLVSATKNSIIQTQLWSCNVGYALALWLSYVVISYFLCGEMILTQHGFYFILNSFAYLLCATTMAFFVSTLIDSKNAMNGVVNVIGLGQAFLCGAFLSVNLLPDFVLKIAHVLPAYWYIQSNEILRVMEQVNVQNLQPVFNNLIVLSGFSFLFFVLTLTVSKVRTRA